MLSWVRLVSAWVGAWQRDGSQRETGTKRKRKDRGTERKTTSRETERMEGRAREGVTAMGWGPRTRPQRRGI